MTCGRALSIAPIISFRDLVIRCSFPMPTEKPLHWISLSSGVEIVDSRTIKFHGADITPPPPAASSDQAPPHDPSAKVARWSVVKSDRRISDGVMRATVRFAEISDRSRCDLALIGIPDGPVGLSRVISAGLTSVREAFSIREFGPSEAASGAQPSPWEWKYLRSEGEREFLTAGQDYDLELAISGSQIRLSVDQVLLAVANSPTLPMHSWNAGLFLLDFNLITISKIEVKPEKPKAFVIMRLDGKYEDLFNFVIKSALDEFDISTIKADDISQPGSVIDDISREIEQSRLIVADISTLPPSEEINANVFFEVGYAYALRKPVILLARKGTPLPFDVRSFRILFYEDSIGGKARLDESLKKYVNEILFGAVGQSQSGVLR